ncbi:MAG: hypothetical protein K2K09_04465, partial [Lachnospiraceae bacterium]|nr:hypothetical protein [Lachnospiraceae bacterium]
INELIMTVLTEDYIPPVILGEEDNSQLWIVDGGQRSSAFRKFRYGNYKISSTIENSVIYFSAKARDVHGNVLTDRNGNIIWEDSSFDIKNKTYEQLPEELKKKFNEYQVETAIHENCDAHRISQLIKRYNNHTSMNTSQKAFTYIDNFARDIRRILDSRFFIENSDFKEKEKNKGVLERVVVETIMCMFHLEDWKKQTKLICSYLNKNASRDEFGRLSDNLHRLEKIITDDTKHIFNSKNSFIFLTLFDRFTYIGVEDVRFSEFLMEFERRLRFVKVNGELFDEVDKGKGTKDKAVITAKLNILEAMMHDYFRVEGEGSKKQYNSQGEVETFISENVGIDIKKLHDDIEFYNETLNDLQDKTIRIGSELLSKDNRLSMLAMIAYSYKEDKDLDDWLAEYAETNKTYFHDQRKNYLYMKKDFERYLRTVS